MNTRAPAIPARTVILKHTGVADSSAQAGAAGRPGMREAALLEALAAGDAAALAELYDRLGSAAYALALAVTRDPASAGEAVVGAFVAVRREARAYRGEECDARAWLLAHVHRCAVARARGRLPRAAAGGEEPVLLAYFGARTCAEIARELGLPAAEVPARLGAGLRARAAAPWS